MSSIPYTVKFFLKSEWKNKYALSSVFIHIFIAVLITYLSLPGIDKALFSSLFWLIVIFTTIQGISKSFLTMNKGHFLYWHQLLSPVEFLITKLIANFLLMFLFTIFSMFIFLVIHGLMVDDIFSFLLIAVVTGTGISSVFTISSSIAAKTDHPGMILPVLTFPLVVPLLLIGVKASKKATDGLGFITLLPETLILIMMNVLIVILGILLVKFIWKE
ncbi:MAG: ABC transporter permease [bacterium]|nr:ABC transporter permease [bacterium]